MERIPVALGTRSYDICIGSGLIKAAGACLRPLLKRPKTIIVTDTHVAALYLDDLQASLTAADIHHRAIILPPGEGTKSFAALESLMDDLLDISPDRKTTLIALGGGVIGDLTGFAASILLRGVDFVQVPTTLLAQVDSSVGGKTGINTRHGKNLIGSFYQPRLVLADTGALLTLPRRERLAGYAEIVKYGLIDDADFFGWLERNGERALAGDETLLAHAVRESCLAKARIVAEDEHESGRRALLNFGHTLGHALEAETGYGERLLHGEAVAVGMMLALHLSRRRGLISEADTVRAEHHMRGLGLPTRLSDVGNFTAEALIAHCYQDKKASDGGLTFILAGGFGKSFIAQDVTALELHGLLAEAASMG